MPIKVDKEFNDLLLLNNIKDRHPKYDVYVTVAGTQLRHIPIDNMDESIEEFIGIRSYLVPVEEQHLALELFSYPDLNCNGYPYFDEDGDYDYGDTFDLNDVSFEIIANVRHFPGLDLFYYEPTDDFVKYHNLHRVDDNWLNPYDKEKVIETGDVKTDSNEPHNTYLKIRKGELVDYLAAKRSGLFIVKYSRRILETPVELLGFEVTFSKRETKYGEQSWIIDRARLDRDKYMYFCQLWESFWLDPAARPRRKDYPGEDEDIAFRLSNGDFNQYDKSKYFEPVSLNPNLIKHFLTLPNHSIQFNSLSILSLVFADGASLAGGFNSLGQFQTLFARLQEIDVEKQKYLSTHSEQQKADLCKEYFTVVFEGSFPASKPLASTLSNCLKVVNLTWLEHFGETLLLSPEPKDIPIQVQTGITLNSPEDLIDSMLELQKSIIQETSIQTIKDSLDLLSQSKQLDGKSYQEMGSIGFIKWFFRIHGPNKDVDESYILDVINRLRNCKGHSINLEKVLTKYNLHTKSPREVFTHIMAEFCLFLVAFNELTDQVLGANPNKDVLFEDDPWDDLKDAQVYFQRPY